MKVLSLLILLSIPLLGFNQSGENIIIVDSIGKPLDVDQNHPMFIYNLGKDTIKLNPLNDSIASYVVQTDPFISYQPTVDSLSNIIRCSEEYISIVDSIDINKDGYKEVILTRVWRCTSSPRIPQQYGVGISSHSFSRFEIWDVRTQKPLLELLSTSNGSKAITTNVMHSFGYHFDITINKKGIVLLSNKNGEGTTMEIGSYMYNPESETYKIEP